MTMPVELKDVPETLLWTLYHRASEARRGDAVLHDPKAVEVLDAIDFPFEERFGSAGEGLSQWQALRALTFDRQVERRACHCERPSPAEPNRSSNGKSIASSTSTAFGSCSTASPRRASLAR